MKRQLGIGLTLTVAALTLWWPRETAAQYAAEVISYSAGTTATPGYTNAATALGAPERFTGEGVFPGVVSPFNPPFLTNELVSIGETGQLTLRLSYYAISQPGVPEIGIFSNVGIADMNYPNGQAGSPATTFGFDSAAVEVSADGLSWTSLGLHAFDVPANGYTDLTDPYSSATGSVQSDFQRPFIGGLGSFSGLRYFDAGGTDVLDMLAGSGGGTWLDISGTGLAQVGYIRFTVPIDLTPGVDANFELDAVSISHAALGGATVPEPATLVLVAGAIAFTATSRRSLRSLPCVE